MATQAEPPGSLRGTVADRSGAVLPGASVRISLAGKVYSTLAAPDGTYSFTGLRPGKYSLRVSYPAMSTYSGDVDIAAGVYTTRPQFG